MAKSTKREVESLAARMAVADEEAFEEFVKIFGPRLRAFFMSKGMRAAEAEDLAVSSITDICLRIEKYERREGKSFEGWVFTLANNFFADYWRSHRKTETLPESLQAPAEAEESPTSRKSVVAAVRHGIEQLSETDQLIVRLRYLEGDRSYDEIGRLLGIEQGAARTRMSRALAHLEKVLCMDQRILDFLKEKGIEVKAEND
jgi:RNA polymerase sigma factor (sigma-70 family)